MLRSWSHARFVLGSGVFCFVVFKYVHRTHQYCTQTTTSAGILNSSFA